MSRVNGKVQRRKSGEGRRVPATADANRKPSTSGDVRSPGFVLCPARSGSTLLRLILNGHPEIACPPETNLVQIFSAVDFSASAAKQSNRDAVFASNEATAEAPEICRDVADQILGAYARARGKAMWIDKSLPSLLFGDLLASVYPRGRFVCLYRQCSDTIASLHESSPWSFDSFGVLPFVQASPVNLVQAFAAYWADRITHLQAFELAHPDVTLRLRYEDLVARPEEAVTRVFEFLGVRSDEATVSAALAFDRAGATLWPGDVKTRFARGIDSSSVGRGWSVPFDMLTEDLRKRVDGLSHELGYLPLPDLKQYTTKPAGSLIAESAGSGPHAEEVKRLIDERLVGGSPAKTTRRTSTLVKLVLTDHPEAVTVNLKSGQVEKRDGEAHWFALTDSETLMSLVSGQSNPAVAMRSSVLQVVSASEQAAPDQFLDCVDDLVTVLRG